MPLLLQLPVEVLLNIFKNLNLPDLYNLMLTCKDIKHLILSSNFIWRSLCRKKFIVHSSSDNGKLGNSSSYNCFRVSCNWCKGVYRNKIVVHHHTNYMPWLKYYNSGVLLLSVGSELRCLPTDKRGMPYHNPLHWKVEVPKVKRQDVRTNDISRFVVSENLIVCGNRDGSTTVLGFNHIEQTPKVLYHLEDCLVNGQVEVSAVELIVGPDQSCAITCSINSSSLLLWHFNTEGPSSDPGLDWTNFCCRDLRFSDEVGIRCLSLDDTKTRLAMGLKGNSKPVLLDINTSQLMMTVSIEMNRRESVRDIRWHDPNTIMVVTHSGKLQHIDARSHEVVFDMMDPFQSSLYCVKSDGERAVLVGTSEYSRCVLFDTRNDTAHVQMYFTQRKTSPVYSLDFDSTKLIAAADRSVAALNFDVHSHTTKAKDYSETFEFVYR